MAGKTRPRKGQNRRPGGHKPKGTLGLPEGPQAPGKMGRLPLVDRRGNGRGLGKPGFGGAGPTMADAGSGMSTYGSLPMPKPPMASMGPSDAAILPPGGGVQGGQPMKGQLRRRGVNDRFLNRLMSGYGDTIRGNQSQYGSGTAGAGGLFGKKQMRGLLGSLAEQGAGRSALRFLMENPAAQMGLGNGINNGMIGGGSAITPDMVRWMRDQGGSVYRGSPRESNHMRYQADLFEAFPELRDAYLSGVRERYPNQYGNVGL